MFNSVKAKKTVNACLLQPGDIIDINLLEKVPPWFATIISVVEEHRDVNDNELRIMFVDFEGEVFNDLFGMREQVVLVHRR